MVRLTDRPDMTLDVYHGRKTTTQQQQQQPKMERSLTSAAGISFWREIKNGADLYAKQSWDFQAK